MQTCPDCATPMVDDVTTCVVCGALVDGEMPVAPVDGEATARHDQEVAMTTETTVNPPGIDPDATGPDAIGPDATGPDATGPDAPSVGATGGAAEPGGAFSPPPAAPSVGDAPGGAGMPRWPASTTAAPGAGASTPPPPHPDAMLLDESARNWGMLAHVSGIVASSLVGMGFIGPLLIWMIKRDDHPFVAQNAVEALNFQLSMLLYGVMLILVSLSVIGLVVTIPLGVIGFILWLVLPVVAAVKTSRGEAWSYPLTIGFLRP